MLTIGQTYNCEFKFTQADVNAFADVSGDHNPVHWDAAFAATTIFKRPILPGMLSASVFSKVLGTLFPGDGTIYLKQSLDFLKPMYVDTDYVALFTVKEIIKEKNRAVIETSIKQKVTGDLVCLIGEAEVMNIAMIN